MGARPTSFACARLALARAVFFGITGPALLVLPCMCMCLWHYCVAVGRGAIVVARLHLETKNFTYANTRCRHLVSRTNGTAKDVVSRTNGTAKTGSPLPLRTTGNTTGRTGQTGRTAAIVCLWTDQTDGPDGRTERERERGEIDREWKYA